MERGVTDEEPGEVRKTARSFLNDERLRESMEYRCSEAFLK